MKNLRIKFKLFLILLLIEICIVISILFQHDFKLTWDDSFPNTLFINSFIALAMAFQAWCAYKEMKKMA